MKTKNQEMIDILMDKGEYAPLYPLVLQSNLSDFQKILISLMLNDIKMNGAITWAHETYAVKLNASRIGVWKQFKKLKEVGIIIPFEDNKAGSKNNKFTVSFAKIGTYEPVNEGNKSKDEPVNEENMSKDEPVNEENMSIDENLLTESNEPVNDEQKPVNDEQKPVNDEQKPVNRGKHIKKLNKPKENNKESIKEENPDDDSFFIGMDLEQRFNYKTKEEPVIKKQELPEDWLNQLELDQLDI